jgi:hypothetical protein
MHIEHQTRYNLSFTAVSLRPELARIVAEHYMQVGNWDMTKVRILSSNALQCRSVNSAVRMERELRKRLKCLTDRQIAILAQATVEDRAAIAWLAALKYIRFVFDFATEVLREKIATHDPILRPSDYESYADNQSVSHPELTQLAASSKNKIRQVLLLMLAEAGLLAPSTALGTLQRPVLSPTVLEAIIADNPCWLAGFLFSDAEIRSLS